VCLCCFSPQSSHYYPGHYPYGPATTASHYRSAQSAHYAPGISQAPTTPHSPVTLSLTPSTATPQPGMKLNRSHSHESGSMGSVYPACANPKGPDYASGSSQRTPSSSSSSSRSPNRSLIPLVTTKLSAEGIILTDEPYSTPVRILM
jgi:hypothetical protein